MSKEIGSSFFLLNKNDEEYLRLTELRAEFEQNLSFYYSGRNALMAILMHIESSKGFNTIWMPSYYCDTVVNMIKKNFNHIQYYHVDPFCLNSFPEINTFASKNDIVIINNFWGLSSFDFKKENLKSISIIEDHTHGWLSKACIESKADYCFCSLRKTYPIPLGAVAWRPNTNDEFNHYTSDNDINIKESWICMESSLKLKRNYLKLKDSTKDSYLNLLNKGEELLNRSNSYNRPNQAAESQIKKYIKYKAETSKKENLDILLSLLEPNNYFKIIASQKNVPFGLLILFKSEEIFYNFKDFLVLYQIYPAHLWPNSYSEYEWKYLFNIHVDFRYKKEDMIYLADIINKWNPN